MRSYSEKENHIGFAVSEILRHRQTEISCLFFPFPFSFVPFPLSTIFHFQSPFLIFNFSIFPYSALKWIDLYWFLFLIVINVSFCETRFSIVSHKLSLSMSVYLSIYCISILKLLFVGLWFSIFSFKLSLYLSHLLSIYPVFIYFSNFSNFFSVTIYLSFCSSH